MKLLMAVYGIGLSSLGISSEPTMNTHCFAPKIFYRNHQEEGYHYKILGGGFEYSLYRPSGINLKLSAITNAKRNNALIENENSVFFRIPLNETYGIYPMLSQRYGTHQRGDDHEKGCFINKSVGYAGIGGQISAQHFFHLRAEVQVFRDLRNTMLWKETSSFTGRTFSNPYGARYKIGVSKIWADSVFFDLEGYFSQTFTKCYYEIGSEISFKWGF